MGEEIETYILKKLEAAIKESADSDNFKWFPKFYLPNLNKDFTELKDLIEKKMEKIKQAAAAAGAANKESTTTTPSRRPGPAVRDAAANVKKLPDVSKDSASAKKVIASKMSPDEKDIGTPAGDKKETDAGDKKETDAPSDDDDDESEISPVTGDDDKSAADADGEKETATFAKTASPAESQISPVTDDVATDHNSKTPPTSANKEPAVSPAHKSTTTDANDEDLPREQLYYLNNVLTEWQMITKRSFSLSSDYVSSIKDLSKTIKKIKLDLKPGSAKKTGESTTPPTASTHNASLIRATPQVEEFRWSTRVVDLKKVYGFEDKILSLERLLVLRRKDADTFKAFGIHGMAGVGKTTLCQSIFSRPKVTEYFFPRIWVCLSKQKDEDEDNRKEAVKRMLRCLGIDDNIINKVDEKQSIRGLLFALRLQLTGKRYLIVLDDAHNPDEWFKMPDSDADNDNSKVYEKFSYGLPKECGGTVIVTSRVEQVVKNMVGEEESLRCIKPLTDQETCWNIFKDTVTEDRTLFPPDLERLKLEIVKRCDGLPLAAKLLGQIKHKELSENLTAANNHPAAVEPGNQQAEVQPGNQQAAAK